jgi:hypothetical protein
MSAISEAEKHLRHQLLISPGRDKLDQLPVNVLRNLLELARAYRAKFGALPGEDGAA